MSIIGAKLVSALQTNDLWSAVSNTVLTLGLALTMAVVVAVPVGIVLGLNSTLFRLTRTMIDLIRPIPMMAAFPLLILLLGTGMKLGIALTFLTSLWPILIQTIHGVRDVDPVTLETARAYGMGRSSRFFHVILPSSMPYIATGLRLGSIAGLLVTIAISMLAGGNGLGHLIDQAQNAGNIAVMYALIVVAGVLGTLLTLILTTIERHVLHWHPSQRGLI